MSLPRYESEIRGHHVQVTERGHGDWMRDHNPDGWDARTWAAFNERIGTDAAFSIRVGAAAEKRHQWVDENLSAQIQGKRLSGRMLSELRRDLMHEALRVHPRPDPFADGWELPEKPEPHSAKREGFQSELRRQANDIRRTR